MSRHPALPFLACTPLLALVACGEMARLDERAGYGPHPTLPEPSATLLPTVNIAPARGCPAGVAIAARGALVVADDVGNTIWRVEARP